MPPITVTITPRFFFGYCVCGGRYYVYRHHVAILYGSVYDRPPYVTVPSLIPPHLSVLDLDRNFLENEERWRTKGRRGKRDAEEALMPRTQ